MTTLILNKPHGVLAKFTDREGRPTLASLVPHRGIYPAGRLDADSEGLLVLTDDGRLQARIAHPRHHWTKTYRVHVEGEIGEDALARLREGIRLRDGPTRPARCRRIVEPAGLWPRDPPVRFRKSVPTSWIELSLTEGRNRQVRRMTAAVGHPTLRLIRWSVGPLSLDGLAPGEWREVDPGELPGGPVRRAAAGSRRSASRARGPARS